MRSLVFIPQEAPPIKGQPLSVFKPGDVVRLLSSFSSRYLVVSFGTDRNTLVSLSEHVVQSYIPSGPIYFNAKDFDSNGELLPSNEPNSTKGCDLSVLDVVLMDNIQPKVVVALEKGYRLCDIDKFLIGSIYPNSFLSYQTIYNKIGHFEAQEL